MAVQSAWDMAEAVCAAVRDRLPAGLAVAFAAEETWRIRGKAYAGHGDLRLIIRFCALVRLTPAGWRVHTATGPMAAE